MKSWYAVYTRVGSEQKVAETLAKKNIETYCPTTRDSDSLHWWKMKKCEKPLFTSRIFVKVSQERLEEVKKCSGVINILYWREQPAVINENEIDSIKFFLSQYKNFSIENTMIDYDKTSKGNVITMSSYTQVGLRKFTKVEIPTLGIRLCAAPQKSDLLPYSIKNAPGNNTHEITVHKYAI